MATTSRTNEELFRQTVESLNERDMAAFADTHADDVVLHDHDEVFHGVDAAVAHEETIYEAFPDMEYVVEDVLAVDDVVAARWRVSGTHEGEFEGIPPTGETVDVPATGFFRIEDGEIASVWLTYDRLGLLEQLGALDRPTE